jgi:hypothetical protein
MSNPKTPAFSVRYDQSDIKYITQFLVSPGPEEVLLDLSSGLLNDGSQPKTLPVQTRIAMPWSSVERLASMLNQVIESKHRSSPKSKATTAPKAPYVPQAGLPSVTTAKPV